MSVAISEISNVFNAQFRGTIDKSDNLSQMNSARTTSNYGVISTSFYQGEVEVEDEDLNAQRNPEAMSGGASSRDNSSTIQPGQSIHT